MNNTGSHVEDFSSAARWIWAAPQAEGAWWMFRKAFSTIGSEIRNAELLITSNLFHIVYINGLLVSRGPVRSYHFAKIYDVIDIAKYIIPNGRNVVAVLSIEAKIYDELEQLAPGKGLLAEIVLTMVDNRTQVISSDMSWKVQRHLSFEPHRPYGVITPGYEEYYDARKESDGWTLPGYNDAKWMCAAELGPVGTPPWHTMAKNNVGLLSNDPISPKALTAIELARGRKGYHVRLTPALDGVMIYFTEIQVPKATDIKLHHGMSKLALDGNLINADAPLHLTEGAHFLAMCRLAYAGGEPEMLFETSEQMHFTATAMLNGQEAEWACLCLPATTVKYPWHERASDILATVPELSKLLAVSRRDELPAEIRARLRPAVVLSPSIGHMVFLQQFFKVKGGFTDPAIEHGQLRLTCDPACGMPLVNARNLLHVLPDTCTVKPQEGLDVHFIIDFEREVIGYLELELDAPTGTIMDVQCFEVISKHGIQWMPSYNSFRYICREGKQTFLSHYRRGFRYVSITLRNFQRAINFSHLRCYHSAYPVQTVGRFECNDERLNRIYRMSVDTAALCMLDNYVDCPGHEQAIWTGDARITAMVNLLTFGAYDLNQHSIRLVGQSLNPLWVAEYYPKDERYTSGRYLPIAAYPNYPEGCLPMWSFMWMMQTWEHYLHGGSQVDLAENFGYMMKTLENCRKLTNERGLFDMPGAWNLIEWGNNDLSPYGEVTANNVLLVQCIRHTANMARVLDKPDIARDLDTDAVVRMAAVNRHCWDDTRNAYVDTVRDTWAYARYAEWCGASESQPVSWDTYVGYTRISEQTNTLTLISGCVPPERKSAVEAIVNRVRQGRYVAGAPAGRKSGMPSQQEAPDGIVAIGSPFFLFFSLEALFQLGKADVALEVMRRDWGRMIESGATTCWESFGGPRSVCHGWSAAPAVYLPANILGIRPLEPGYRKFVIKPYQTDLQWARGTVATPYGPIYASWQKNNIGKMDINCSAPEECIRVLLSEK